MIRLGKKKLGRYYDGAKTPPLPLSRLDLAAPIGAEVCPSPPTPHLYTKLFCTNVLGEVLVRITAHALRLQTTPTVRVA